MKGLKLKNIKMKYNKIIIYGGTSEISLALIDMYIDECERLIIFCRSKKKFVELRKNIGNLNSENLKVQIFEVELNDLAKNLEIIDKMDNDISGIIWVAGYTGDGYEEFENIGEAEKNIKINFLNPVMILTEISKKIRKNSNSFIAVFTSVAGLRGRKKQLYYSSSKSGLIAFLSALRQKLFKYQISVTTVIPGYMNTKPFREGNFSYPSLLIAEPKKVAQNLKKAIEKNKEIIYINSYWKIIMTIVKLIPEKLFKRFSF